VVLRQVAVVMRLLLRLMRLLLRLLRLLRQVAVVLRQVGPSGSALLRQLASERTSAVSSYNFLYSESNQTCQLPPARATLCELARGWLLRLY
jgi:hypothetical protein